MELPILDEFTYPETLGWSGTCLNSVAARVSPNTISSAEPKRPVKELLMKWPYSYSMFFVTDLFQCRILLEAASKSALTFDSRCSYWPMNPISMMPLKMANIAIVICRLPGHSPELSSQANSFTFSSWLSCCTERNNVNLLKSFSSISVSVNAG